jgi:hypothetical protein
MVAMDSVGRYRLIRRLGVGSFATVWLGHDDDLDVSVAVKVLADNWASNSDARSRFLAEARIMRRIHDRRLVQVYDIGTLDDGRPYFVMDYVDGGSLNDLRRQGISPVRALRLCADACRALDVLRSNAPTALLLAEALERIAGQMESAGAFEQVPKTIMTTHASPRIESPLAAEVTAPHLPRVTGPYPSFAPPPLAPMSGFEPASPYCAAPAQPAFQGPSQPLTGGYLNSAPRTR